MGTYSQVRDVTSLFRNLNVNASDSAVSESEVSDIIDEVESEIESRLTHRYITPITGPKSLRLINKIVRLKAAQLVATILGEFTTFNGEEGNDRTFAREADALLNAIAPLDTSVITAPMILVDAQERVHGQADRGLFAASFSEVSEKDEVY